jgi:hypothetical protein
MSPAGRDEWREDRRSSEDLGDDVIAELDDIAGHDPHQAQVLRRSLERLRDGVAGPALQEMARDVLAGNTTLRSAMSFSFYQEELTRGLERFHDWQRDTDPATVQEAVEEARAAQESPSWGDA